MPEEANKAITAQFLKEPRRRAGLNLPCHILWALPRAELLHKTELILKRAGLTLLFLLLPLKILLLTASAFAAPPTVGFIIPFTGSTAPDTAKTFICLYSDKDGWKNLKEAYLLISTSPAQLASSAYLYYDQNSNKLYLRNDTNTVWLGGYTPGSSNTIENSYVQLNCRSTAVFGLSNTLIVKWNISFKPAYSGKTYKTYLKVADDTGGSAGWTQKGGYTINQAPQAGAVTPSSGSFQAGQPLSFSTTYTDPDGWQNIQYLHLLVNTAVNGANCFYAYYNQNTNKLYLRNDANTAWLGGFSPGSANIIENSYAKLNCASTTATGTTNTLTVNWQVTFKSAFLGAKNIYLYLRDDLNAYQNWAQRGKITIQNQSDTTPPTGSISINNNANYTNSASVTLNLFAQDNTGGSGLAQMQFSNNNSSWSTPEAYTTTKTWSLATTGDGVKTVYVKYKDAAGNWSQAYSDMIILSTNHPPVINAITPFNNSTFLAGAGINIEIDASDPDSDPLEYQFSIGGAIKQPWSASNNYTWQTTASDTGAVSIACEVKDSKGALTSKAVSYSIINPALEEILQKVADNYAKISDFSADMTLSSTLDGKPFGATDYCRYYFKAPNKEKTETFNDATRTVKNDIIIINGANMHLIDPINNIKQTVDLLADAGINSTEFSQLDLYYNQALFLSKNTVSKNDLNTDFSNMIIALDTTPNEKNNIYDKLGILIDYDKGLITKFSIYRKNQANTLELVQETVALEFQKMPNHAWLPVKMTKNPNLTSGNLISTLVYGNLKINQNLLEEVFDPNKQ